MEIDLEQLRELMRSLDEFGVNELELEREDERIFLRRGVAAVSTSAAAPGPAPGPGAAAASATPATATASAQQAEAEEDPSVVYVTSPFVGTFYRAPSPTSEPFVEVGQTVKPGQSLCIIEAMKLMNEIEAELACTILEILVENGKPVEYGDRLFKVRKS